MKRYVLGFAFHYDKEKLLLITKKSQDPDMRWQDGKLNGLGGKREAKEYRHPSLGHVIYTCEDSELAMIREFQEEAGIKTKAADWRHFATLNGKTWDVRVFTTTIDIAGFQARTNPNGELVRVYKRSDFFDGTHGKETLVDRNLFTLMMHATDPSITNLVINYK